MTTLRSGLCYRKSVCLSSVCNVGAPYSLSRTFRRYFFTAVHLGHPLTFTQNFTQIVPWEPLRRDVKRNRSSKIERWWTYYIYVYLSRRQIEYNIKKSKQTNLLKAISHKRYKIDVCFLLKTNRKSYVLYRMVILLISLGDP